MGHPNADQLQSIAKVLDNGFNSDDQGEKVGFALLTFGFDAPGIGQYISNADRTTMIQALRELADRLERNQDNPRFD